MLDKLKTFNINNKKSSTPEEIEKQFEMTRNDYLKEMNKVRKKYQTKFMKLTSAYGAISL